ncbi:acetoacetate--CoA ligase [Conexibacter sp. DBS9H8]|uniref:acetoacetate--CoA ligase n=1 Tax=Conexibacter sp. DBS9H8 TaxID=2937801 RepID=UPI00200D05DA|nr:acetoacetate--CoA ligase [Conexibacter sp. DBS9H8]
MESREVLWTPSADRVAQARLTDYVQWLDRRHGLQVKGYEDLWHWSTQDLDGFWGSISEYFGVRFHRKPERILGSERMPGAQWFPGAELNYADHIFAGRDPGRVAIRHASELRSLDHWTWGRLALETAQMVARLRVLGVGQGDRVCAYLPNLPETVAAFLATASLGAIWSSAAPEFGARAVIDRFAQVAPKVLLAVDGYRYGGRDFDRRGAVAEIAAAIPSAPAVLTFGYLYGGGWSAEPEPEPETAAPPRVEHELSFTPVAFDHPLWILYSSGTTGLPKAIVQSQGGILLEQLKFGGLHLDASATDNVFWFTTTGWMMWNLLVGVLLTDAAIVLFDGNPGYPDLHRLWELAAAAQITTFGTSAAYLSSCAKARIEPARGRDLSRLRAVGSTGSPLSPDGFRWVYEHVGSDIWLFSTSGGTDVCTAFVGGVPTLPVRAGELQARALGAALAAWDESGQPVVGEVGELVLTRPMPSMPVAFWGDDDGVRLRESYFSTYPGVWRHGDWIELTPSGGAIIHGRSDSTINRGGVRIGTAEIYAAVLACDAVIDALVIDLGTAAGDGSIELFVVLADGTELTDELVRTLTARIRETTSPRHVPDRITAVDAVPRTLSGKLLEVPVKRILTGTPVDRVLSRESLADPAVLDGFLAAARTALADLAPDGS